MTNILICEYPLPLPKDKLEGEDEQKDFKDIKWNELPFHTSSFFEVYDSDYYQVISYTISEDGQFYKYDTSVELVSNKNGIMEIKEGETKIERRNFTGEIFFGADVLGENNDYLIIFKALFYKGELKEIELEKWDKACNEERKKPSSKLYDKFRERREKENKWLYKLLFFVKRIISKSIIFMMWTLAKVFNFLSAIRKRID